MHSAFSGQSGEVTLLVSKKRAQEELLVGRGRPASITGEDEPEPVTWYQ